MPHNVFLALPLPIKLALPLSRARRYFIHDTAGLDWQGIDDMHVTLYFFGETRDIQLVELKKQIGKTTSEIERLKLRYECITFALPGRVPKIIWAEFTATDAYRFFVHELSNIGFSIAGIKPPHKDIIPHATLARIRTPEEISLDDVSRVERIESQLGVPDLSAREYLVTYCDLLVSRPAASGSRYELLERFYFK